MDNSKNIVHSLGKIPVLYGLDDDELKVVLSICKAETFNKDMTLFYQGAPSHDMYILLSGQIEIVTEQHGCICTLSSCDLFGEIGLITQQTRSASAITLTACKLLKINHVQFNLLTGTHPRISAILMKNISTNLASHVLRMNNALALEHIPQEKHDTLSEHESLILFSQPKDE